MRSARAGCGGHRLRDFHSFRVTWVTLALTAGVPLELVQKVTGHLFRFELRAETDKTPRVISLIHHPNGPNRLGDLLIDNLSAPVGRTSKRPWRS